MFPWSPQRVAREPLTCLICAREKFQGYSQCYRGIRNMLLGDKRGLWKIRNEARGGTLQRLIFSGKMGATLREDHGERGRGLFLVDSSPVKWTGDFSGRHLEGCPQHATGADSGVAGLYMTRTD